jgi:hypothetical protein
MFPSAPDPTNWRLKLERAADLVVALATLESIGSVRELFGLDEPAPSLHPHRGPALRPRPRTGRPGTVATRAHVCAPASTSRLRGRSTHQRASH